jgi:hypothetical protein
MMMFILGVILGVYTGAATATIIALRIVKRLPLVSQPMTFDLAVNASQARVEIGVVSKEVDLLNQRCLNLLSNMERINDQGQPGAGAGTQNKAECAVQSLRPGIGG